MNVFDWTCPHCNRATTIIESTNVASGLVTCTLRSVDGPSALSVRFISCPNSKCKRLTLDARLYRLDPRTHDPKTLVEIWRLIPESHARVYDSDVVPQPIIDSYREACRIASLSPMASATLSRRALQGIIRKFWDIQLPNLKLEVDAIKDKVDPDTWGAIEAVRNVGNIGAHMEKDTNLIQDVEQDEAEKLIWLVETLIDDTFVAKHKRASKLEEVKRIGDEKASERAQLKAAAGVDGSKDAPTKGT